jgi:hypothetical protein
MRRSRGEKRKPGLAYAAAAVVGAGAVAGWLAGVPLPAGSDPSPATVVARRFPMIWSVADPTPPARAVATLPAADNALRELFSPHPVYPPATAPSPVVSAAQSVPPKPDATGAFGKQAVAARSPNAARSNAVLNDAQIESIKARLNLTAEQERHWPALETALRKLAWKKPPPSPRRAAAPPPTVDPVSADVDRFKSAAAPLMLSFSPEQKREVRALIHVVGLDKLLADF